MWLWQVQTNKQELWSHWERWKNPEIFTALSKTFDDRVNIGCIHSPRLLANSTLTTSELFRNSHSNTLHCKYQHVCYVIVSLIKHFKYRSFPSVVTCVLLVITLSSSHELQDPEEKLLHSQFPPAPAGWLCVESGSDPKTQNKNILP